MAQIETNSEAKAAETSNQNRVAVRISLYPSGRLAHGNLGPFILFIAIVVPDTQIAFGNPSEYSQRRRH